MKGIIYGVITNTIIPRSFGRGTSNTQRKVQEPVDHYSKKLTLLAEELQLITAETSIDLRILERMEFRKGNNRSLRNRYVCNWQEAWSNDTVKASSTKKLISDITTWYKCDHIELGYYLTKFLTRQGSYRKYLYRMNKVNSHICPYCGDVDTPGHIVFRWNDRSTNVLKDVEVTELNVSNIVDHLTCSKQNFCHLDG